MAVDNNTVTSNEEFAGLKRPSLADEEEYQREHRVAEVFISFYVVFILLILVGNGLVIGLVFTKKKLHSTTNFFIVSLCISGRWYKYKLNFQPLPVLAASNSNYLLNLLICKTLYLNST